MSWGRSEGDRRLANVIRVATITAVDAGAGRARVSFGGDTESAWLPFPSPRAGDIQIWAPPSVGEQVVVACPSGDTAQGLIVASLSSGASPPPSGDGGAFVVKIGDASIEITADGLTLTAGGVSLAVTAGGVSITGGQVDHNGTNIGDSHVHGGVVPGASNTQGPQ